MEHTPFQLYGNCNLFKKERGKNPSDVCTIGNIPEITISYLYFVFLKHWGKENTLETTFSQMFSKTKCLLSVKYFLYSTVAQITEPRDGKLRTVVTTLWFHLPYLRNQFSKLDILHPNSRLSWLPALKWPLLYPMRSGSHQKLFGERECVFPYPR